MKMNFTLLFLLLAGSFSSCQKDLLEFRQDDIRISIEQGSEWLHDFPLFMCIKKKNPPQIAIWMEDIEGNYISTLYVSHKVAHNDWQMAKGNDRKEALPVWTHLVKERASVDGVSGATPRGSFDVNLNLKDQKGPFVVKVEVNHSTDFNIYYPENAKEGESNYSGGKQGSGQPALVYVAVVEPSRGCNRFEAVLAGHSSPDGSTGKIYKDMAGITTAKDIIKRIEITVQ